MSMDSALRSIVLVGYCDKQATCVKSRPGIGYPPLHFNALSLNLQASTPISKMRQVCRVNISKSSSMSSGPVEKVWDVIIVGGGAAGLNAALVLGRCRRNVLLFDEGKPRNSVSHRLHGFLSRDGMAPADFLSVGREQLSPYETVALTTARVVDANRQPHGFSVQCEDGQQYHAKKLLLTTGVVDHLPPQPGFRELYGFAVFVCPYCDGWEMRDRPLAVYGSGDDKGGGLALEMTIWSRDIVLCTDGPGELSDSFRQRLTHQGIAVREEKILRLAGVPAVPHRSPFKVEFESGPALPRDGLFFNTDRHQASDLAGRLGSVNTDHKGCAVDTKQMTDVPGLYVAGDASKDVLQLIVAAAEGAQAAIAINTALLHEGVGSSN